MANKRAIDKLKEAFCIDNRSRYIIKKEGCSNFRNILEAFNYCR